MFPLQFYANSGSDICIPPFLLAVLLVSDKLKLFLLDKSIRYVPKHPNLNPPSI